MVVVLCTADTDNSGPGRTQVLLLESWGSSHCVLGQAVKGSPMKNSVKGIRALPVRGGGSKPLPGWFGATFLGIFPSFWGV